MGRWGRGAFRGVARAALGHAVPRVDSSTCASGPRPRVWTVPHACRCYRRLIDSMFAAMRGNKMTDEQAALCVQAYWRRYLSVIYYQVY